jgi:dipeptidyl aminopeptidase/acylaminoacyl peptidase
MSVSTTSVISRFFLMFCLATQLPFKIVSTFNEFINWINPPIQKTSIFNEGWTLAFSRIEASKNGIYIISNEGIVEEITEDSESWYSFTSISWSPDGKQIAYVRGAVGINNTEIVIVNINRKGIVKKTYGSDPAWSPDGKNLVFIRNDDIYTMNLETDVISLLHKSDDLIESAPEWSPNGEFIAYVAKERYRDGNLFVMKIDGTNSQKVKMEESVDIYSGISWSPDSRKIAFISQRQCGDVYVFDLITNKSTNLTNTIGDEVNPSWSPDGHSIVFSSMQPSNKCPKPDDPLIGISYKIYSINDDGSNYHEISIPFNNAWINSPKWSPAIGLQQSHTFSITLFGDNLHLREAPSIDSKIIETLRIGTILTPQNGSQMNNGYRWWKVKIKSSGIEGWVVDEPGYFRPANDDNKNIQQQYGFPRR